MKFHTLNPATGDVLKEYQTMSADEVQIIAKAAHAEHLEWRSLAIAERALYFRKLAHVLRKNQENYARVMTLEMGKAITESRKEIEKCAWTAEVYADHAVEWLQEEVLQADGKEHLVTFEPLGVILSIMPWNFPFWQALRFAIPTMIAGNASLLKHASAVTGCSLAIEEAFQEAGFPQDLFRSIIADHNTVATLIGSDLIAGVSLTGSTTAGKRIGELAGRNLKKVVLELGGSDPFIVLDDADLDIAAKNAAQGRFLNCGQSCIAAKRFIVVEKIAAQFIEKFSNYVGQKKVGDPLQEDTDVGPLVNESARFEIEAQVADAIENGATIKVGGKRLPGKGYFYLPTVLTNIKPGMKVITEEVFGPVAPVIIVKDEMEAVEVANSLEYGLGGSVWTKDLERGKRVARELDCGCAFINSIVKSDPRIPFGGTKQSGLGRELGKYGLKEFVNIKAINVYEMK